MAKGADQVPITQRIDQWQVGRALPGDADVTEIRKAVEEVLADPHFGEEAQNRARAFAGHDGAQLAADSVEGLIPGAA